MVVRLACLLLMGFALIGLTGRSAQALPVCPNTGSTNTDCGLLITIAADGSISSAAVSGANPYDGSDDSLVGVINNMTTAFTGTIHLTGSGNGGGIFAFDGDGICTFISCSGTQTGYEGPNNTFANITASGTAGDVVFNVAGGIAAGGTSYFSLESSPSSIAAGGGLGTNPVPEPASLALMGAGLLALCGVRRHRRRRA